MTNFPPANLAAISAQSDEAPGSITSEAPYDHKLETLQQ